ncbi:NUDIX domain-containing protein [Streptomyces sp. NPDC096311]|uniref:NUDIX domain-containing protein n=1 Tax=Streptomyces sp. NPDC096311 TaxID=3366083 RepID=UPI003810ABE3
MRVRRVAGRSAYVRHVYRVWRTLPSVPEPLAARRFRWGKVAPGETVGQAAVREALGEAGAVVEPLSLVQAWAPPGPCAPGQPVATHRRLLASMHENQVAIH